MFRDPTSLYVHIPFCESKCSYCAFNSFGRNLWTEDMVRDYLEALAIELASYRKTTTQALRTVFIGGGTPSMLSPQQITRLGILIRDNFDFDPHNEWTMEMNPGSVHDEKIQAAQEIGVNRLSLGAQTFSPERLRYLERAHTPDDIHRSVQAIQVHGITNFNLDLIFGLPDQKEAGFANDLASVLAINPPHLSLYNLQFEEGTELTRQRAEGSIVEEDEEVQRRMYLLALDYTKDYGIRPYEISNFARDGFECRHNLNYWENNSYIGVGAGAFGCVAGQRYRNSKEILRYTELMNSAGGAIGETEFLTPEKALVETVITGLRRTAGIQRDRIQERFPGLWPSSWDDLIERYLDLRLIVELRPETFALTNEGVLVSDSVFAEFVEWGP